MTDTLPDAVNVDNFLYNFEAEHIFPQQLWL